MEGRRRSLAVENGRKPKKSSHFLAITNNKTNGKKENSLVESEKIISRHRKTKPFKKSSTKKALPQNGRTSSPTSFRRRMVSTKILKEGTNPSMYSSSLDINKENNGSTHDGAITFNSSTSMLMDDTTTAKRKTVTKKNKKKIMTCSELQRLNDATSSTRVQTRSTSSAKNKLLVDFASPKPLPADSTNSTINDLSPASASSSVVRGRKGSDLMKYSSLASDNNVRVPSAKTLTDQCFPSNSTSSSSASSVGLVLSSRDVENRKSVSPSTLKLLNEVENAYQKSPIPASYIRSPIKKSPVIPKISLPKTSTSDERCASAVNLESRKVQCRTECRLKSTITKKTVDASTLLANERSGREIGREASDRNKRSTRQPSPYEMSSQWYSAPSTSSSNQSLKTTSTVRSSTPSKNKPVALAVQREKQQRRQKVEEDNCKIDGRRNLDKRTARLRYASAFKADIIQYRTRFSCLNNGTNHGDKSSGDIQKRGINGVSIAIRKRPIFDYELERNDYDVISIDNTSESSHDVCILHNCVMHHDMKQMLIKPTKYPVTAAFDENCSDDSIYKHIAEPLVRDAANAGLVTLLMYGQTGCGKSYTMSGIESRMAYGLFEAVDSIRVKPTITMQFIELCGSKEINDLFDPKSSGDVKLLDNDDGSVQLVNAMTIEIRSPEELLNGINIAKGRRATEATEKNGVSSRSHAVCQIQIKGKYKRGVLTLIDCAGSERRHDSMYHSSERQKESAEINASLWALKECIRARASKSSRIPYRNSSLTRILRESLENENGKLCVIACVAPNSTDTEHTMETLKTVSTIVGIDDRITEERAHAVTPQTQQHTKSGILLPKQWDHEQLKTFLTKKKITRVKLTEKYDGRVLMKMSQAMMRTQLFDEGDKELADTLFNVLRRENDRVSKIQRKERTNIANERKGKM